MHEETIVQVLAGEVTPSMLNAEAIASTERVNAVRERVHVVPLERTELVTREGVLRLCSAAASGELSAPALRAVAFAIVSSDHLEWDDDLVGEILHDWSAPEINLALTPENMARFEAWLTGGAWYPEKSQAPAVSSGRIISELERVNSRA